MLSTEELLRKAVLSSTDGGSADFGNTTGGIGPANSGVGQAPLSIEQVTTFIELMAASQSMLSDVRTVTSNASKWQESIISFASRIARPGNEATRLADTNAETRRVAPETGRVEISTVLLRAEVPVSDEVLEDNVAGQNLVNSLERLITDRFGFDIEELMVNGDTSLVGSDPYIGLLDGWLKQAHNLGNAVDATTYGSDYQSIFQALLQDLPIRFTRNLQTDGRFYIPIRAEMRYRDILASRGTALGDIMLTGNNELQYQGVTIKGVPSFDAGVASGKGSVLLAHSQNLYAGFHRAMKFETWRDPREGATSFIVTARVDAKIAIPRATAIAYNVTVDGSTSDDTAQFGEPS